jgi:hypothetical protein
MRLRTRKYFAGVGVVVLATAVSRVSDALGLSKAETYGAAAATLVVFCLVALPWIEMAPDGAWRRSPRG